MPRPFQRALRINYILILFVGSPAYGPGALKSCSTLPFLLVIAQVECIAMIRIDANPKSVPTAIAEPTPQVQAVPASARSAIKSGTVVILTPTALKLSRELQAITTDSAKDPAERLDALDRLRKLTAKAFSEK